MNPALSARGLHDLLTHTNELLCVLELPDQRVCLGGAWERVLGYQPAEVEGTPIGTIVFPDDLESLRDLRGRALAGEACPEVITQCLARDGSPRWIAWRLLAAPEGERAYLIGKDITELRLWQQKFEESTLALRQRNEELADALRAARAATKLKSEFVANTSHEIRTPMNAVVGLTDLLLTTPLSDEQREYAGMLRDSAKSLLSILNDLLEFSRLEARSAAIEWDEFDLRDTVAAVTHLMYPRAFEHNLGLSCFVGPEVPGVLLGDARRLRQVLLNLVSNAIKFTALGRVETHVEVAARSAGRITLRFEVRDTGPGIAAEDQERIFEPFIQAQGSAARQFGGTGLGLAISRQIVHAAGGSIGVTSVPGEGSVFAFTMPFGTVELKPAGPSDEPVADMDGPLPLRILLAEDNLVNQHLMRRLLEKEGCTVDVADGGRRAVELASLREYDLILMDVQMPEMDGLAATAAIRRQEDGRPRVPIVALTANAVAGDRERCLAAGMDDYLSKPVTRAGLRRDLSRWAPRPPVSPAGSAGRD